MPVGGDASSGEEPNESGDDVSYELDEESGENAYEEIKHIEISTDENSNFVIKER